MISEKQRQFYAEQGYLVIRDLLPASLLQKLQDETTSLNEAVAAAPESLSNYELEAHLEQKQTRRIFKPHVRRPVFNQLIRSPEITTVLTALLGPNVRLQTSKLHLKPKGGAPIYWHQDWAYYPHTNDDVLALGIFLDDVNVDSGPLLVVPGSHTGDLYDHHFNGHFCGVLDPEPLSDQLADAVPLTGPAGTITIHHVRLVHGSGYNHGPHDRRFLIYEVAAADAWPLFGSFNAFNDLAEFDSRIVAGQATHMPRLVPTPVRMPLPAPSPEFDLNLVQREAGRFYFEAQA